MNTRIRVWYNQIGFHNNPFSIKASKYDHRILGSEEKVREIMNKISQGAMIYAHGEYGTGKTTMLKRIIREFGGYRNIFYHSCNSGEKLDIPKLLKGKYRLLGRLLNLKARGMILLLDEVQCLTPEEEQEILQHYSQKYIKTVILVGKDEEVNLSHEMKQAIGDNVYSFGTVTDENAVAMIRRRIGNLPLLSDEAIREINRRSQRNPRFLLENCEDICRNAIDHGQRRVTEAEVREFFHSR
ncbi:AAA family ATPase [Candidatus Woesearchaeota archaeon]|nr:AAA family ATPase [Candidatus Woesearchaeota archaeon]